MSKQDKEKTAFLTSLGKFQFTRMPFVLKTHHSCFNAWLTNCSMGLRLIQLDILLFSDFSNSWEDHVQHLKEVLQRLRKACFTLRTDKCLIGESSCTLLGHEVGKGKIIPTDAKIEAI